MFSFIKWLQASLSRLKQNKGLWFTTLSVLSSSGILISMYLINTMTTNVAHQTYMEEHRTDINHLDSLLMHEYDSLINIASILAIHPEVANAINNKKDKQLKTLLKQAQTAINKNANISPVTIKFYSKDHEIEHSENIDIAKLIIETDQSVSGIVVNLDGVRILGMVPVIDKNVTIGTIEVTNSIHSLKGDFERVGKEFTFLVTTQQLVHIDLEHKQGSYKKINDEYSVAFHNYDSSFYINAQKLNFDELKREKYKTDSFYYTTYDNITDLNGRMVGIALIGEGSDNANSFVKITQNMINSVTTVALGLVISLILFMF